MSPSQRKKSRRKGENRDGNSNKIVDNRSSAVSTAQVSQNPREAAGTLTTSTEPATSYPQLVEQQRAAYALQSVEAALADECCKNSEFKAYARRLPAMIQTNGLGQASAFYRSKGAGNRAYQRHYQQLSDWLTGEQRPYAAQGDLLEGITSQDMYRYREAQAEALALLSWVKKFAEALCRDESQEQGTAAQ